MFLRNYFPPSMVTKLRNEITNFRQRPDESLFEAWECYKLSIDGCPNHNMLPTTQIDTFYNGLTLIHRDTTNTAAGGTFMKRPLKAEMAEINKNLMKVLQINQHVKAVTPSHETCGCPHSYNDCPATVGQLRTYMLRKPIIKKVILTNLKELGKQSWNSSGDQPRKKPILLRSYSWSKPASYLSSTGLPSPGLPRFGSSSPDSLTASCDYYMKANNAILKNMQTNMTSLTNSNLELKNMFGQFMKMNTASSLGSGTLPSNTITNPKEDLKGITTQSGNTYKGPMIPRRPTSGCPD
nr:reverse transcriptase domain-containing protein [Tanacetum cinerariifolium]